MATFQPFASEDIVITTDKAFTSTWSNNTNNLTTAHTSSAQASFSTATSSGQFYINVYNEATSSSTAAVQYAIAYGHVKGSGSLDFTNDTGSFGYSATRDIYSQYRNLVFGGDETQQFVFDTVTPDDIYVININRARYKQALKPGSLNLQIQSGSTAINLALTDDSVTRTGSAVITNVGRQFNIVSGTNGVMSGSTLGQTISGSYGLFYPDAGFIILNPRALDLAGTNGGIELGTLRNSNTSDRNNERLFNQISGAGHFILDSQENISSQYFFARIKNRDFNYSTNPSFIDDSGNLNFASMVDNPQTYITTIGLYNNNNDLIAVAKLSQPLNKNFTKESLVKVKLDY
jgi:hypothetical protein